MPTPFQIIRNFDLSDLTTFGVPARATSFLPVHTIYELRKLLETGEKVKLILGGGSNILFTRDVPGLVVHNKIFGIEIIEKGSKEVIVEAGGGETWHKLVLWTLEQGLSGLENLALIPGTVGAAPIQNIGAYGVELRDRFAWLRAVDLETGEPLLFFPNECDFGYRYSFFKGPGKGKYMITHVALRLDTSPQLQLGYGAIRSTLQEIGVDDPTPKDVCNAVVQIRRSKLPDPAQLGNAGSFFKNPVVEKSIYEKILKDFPAMPAYPVEGGGVKVPAGWLIEQCGWKGKRIGNTGCHAKQALVIVNYGEASGSEIKQHALRVQASVLQQFGIQLDQEVNIL